MPNTPRMKWPYPSEDQDPWHDAFRGMAEALDASGAAAREDRNLIMGGGGVVSFDGGADTLSWSSDLSVLVTSTGTRLTVPVGGVSLEDGEVLYTDVVRYAQSSSTLEAKTSNVVPNTDTAYVIAVRYGDTVYFRHGFSIESGSGRELFSGASSDPSVIIWLGGRASHNSNVTPLTVGAIEFSPTIHNPLNSLIFRAIAANGDVGLTNYVQLFNTTDNELVAQLEYTTTALAKDEISLVLGGLTGEIDEPAHIYEVRLLLGAAPGGGSHTVELYSAELRVF